MLHAGKPSCYFQDAIGSVSLILIQTFPVKEYSALTTFVKTNVPFLGLFWRYGGALRWMAIGLVLGAFLLFPFHPSIASLLLIGLVLGLAFFRCPDCAPASTETLVAPATGRVDDIEQVTDCPGIGGAATKIGIFLSVLDVHVTRAPLAGAVKSVQFIPGRCGNAMSRQVGHRNQRNEILLETKSGQPIFVRQISGAIARRVMFDPSPGDRIHAGAVVGMIRFGSRMELFIPHDSDFQLEVKMGDRVHAGETILGRTKAWSTLGIPRA
jgi:phosphatidylserine decarboxylase